MTELYLNYIDLISTSLFKKWHYQQISLHGLSNPKFVKELTDESESVSSFNMKHKELIRKFNSEL